MTGPGDEGFHVPAWYEKPTTMIQPKIPVAREGVPFIAFAALLTMVVAMLGYDILSVSGLVLTAFVLYFFRDPERVAPDAEDAVVAPADGKIIVIEKVFDEKFVKEHAYKISIFMNVFNVHVNRTPVAGEVKEIIYTPGSFLAANTEQAALGNENCGVIITMPDRGNLAVVQVAGLIARRIVCWAEKGDLLQRCQRFGLIRFGSRVDIYLPQKMQLEVSVGQKVRAGETVLGYFV